MNLISHNIFHFENQKWVFFRKWNNSVHFVRRTFAHKVKTKRSFSTSDFPIKLSSMGKIYIHDNTCLPTCQASELIWKSVPETERKWKMWKVQNVIYKYITTKLNLKNILRSILLGKKKFWCVKVKVENVIYKYITTKLNLKNILRSTLLGKKILWAFLSEKLNSQIFYLYVLHSQSIQLKKSLKICTGCLCLLGTVLGNVDAIDSALTKHNISQMRNFERNRYIRLCWTSDLKSTKSAHKYKWLHWYIRYREHQLTCVIKIGESHIASWKHCDHF